VNRDINYYSTEDVLHTGPNMTSFSADPCPIDTRLESLPLGRHHGEHGDISEPPVTYLDQFDP